MTLDEYQHWARSTAVYASDLGAIYTALGLAGETGEVIEHVKKMARDDNRTPTPERLEKLRKEMGDVLWYLANLASDLGLSLGDIADANKQKVEDRKARGTLHGSGDNR